MIEPEIEETKQQQPYYGQQQLFDNQPDTTNQLYYAQSKGSMA